MVKSNLKLQFLALEGAKLVIMKLVCFSIFAFALSFSALRVSFVCFFHIRNLILTFEMGPTFELRPSKSYFEIRNGTFKILF